MSTQTTLYLIQQDNSTWNTLQYKDNKWHTRVLPNPRVVCPPSMMVLGLNPPHPRWCLFNKLLAQRSLFHGGLLSKCSHARCSSSCYLPHVPSCLGLLNTCAVVVLAPMLLLNICVWVHNQPP